MEQLTRLLGHGRAKKGLFKVNMNDGELQIVQVPTLIKLILALTDFLMREGIVIWRLAAYVNNAIFATYKKI